MPELGLMTAPWTSFPRRICEIPAALVLQPGEEEVEAPVADGSSEGEWEEVAIWRGNSVQVSTMTQYTQYTLSFFYKGCWIFLTSYIP